MLDTPKGLDAVVFDIGNVLIDWDPRRPYRAAGLSEQEIHDLFERLGFAAWNLEQDRGRTWAEAVEVLSAQFPDDREMIELYDKDWMTMVSGAIEGTVDILNTLSGQDVPLHSITNFSVEKFALAKSRFAFLDLFDVTIVSGEEKMLKPDPAIYRTLLARTGLAPERCVFIDDSQKNVEGARAIGMRAIHFTAPADLREALRGFELPKGAVV